MKEDIGGKEKLGIKKVGKVNKENERGKKFKKDKGKEKTQITAEEPDSREGRGGKEVPQFSLLMVMRSFNMKHISRK